MDERFTGPLTATIDVGRVRLSDETATAKWQVWSDPWSVPLGKAVRRDARLVFSVTPNEWIVIGGDEPDNATDLTHVRAMFRLTGAGSVHLLEHLCALDLGDRMTPDHAAARTLLAGVAIELVRDDVDGEPSYLLLMSRSFARSVWDRLARLNASA